jgi:hypothetical protein
VWCLNKCSANCVVLFCNILQFIFLGTDNRCVVYVCSTVKKFDLPVTDGNLNADKYILSWWGAVEFIICF